MVIPMSDQHHRYDSHSTLEVCLLPPQLRPELQVAYDTTLPAVATDGNAFPEAVKVSNDGISMSPIEQNAPSPQLPERRIRGTRKKTLWILAAILTLIITAVGVGVGVWKYKQGYAGGKSTSIVWNESKLSAVNWTYDQHNFEAVFWQATNSSLMMSLLDSDNTTWEVTEISSRIRDNRTISPALGTSLGAAPYTGAQGFRLLLVYTNENNELQGLQTLADPRGDWAVDDISIQSAKTSGSQLAVIWNDCGWGCATVFYVGEDQSLMSLRRLSGTKPAKIENANSIRKGSGLSAVVIDPNPNTNGSHIQPHVFFDQSSTQQEVLLSFDTQYLESNYTCTIPLPPH